ncbi:MAG: DNA mismatch repair endonuclease MutL [Lachnospiraceae bacterium]|nr:DNA mismatch repair endonuclease MutL [Lachnospiraceae bacterium]
MIKVLDQSTINKIAAGEVVERPSSVVKELVENAIDAGANAVTVEIKEGGLSFIRITDNGQGIEKDDVPTAFVRHATSKITTIEDLLSVSSLGFRGEALASIAAVAQVECITKTAHSLTGIRYEIHGGKEIASEEIGAPTGTTIIVRNLFYNVPARKKFLKTAMTEGSYITELITRLALSHPEVSFKYIINGSNKIATSGNGALKDVIYHVYGKDVSANLLPVKRDTGEFGAEGYVGKAFVSKGNRSFEHYFVNGRYIRSNIITKAIEEAYKSFVMIHKFPFTCLHFKLDSTKLDVNVHPAKMEFKYAEGEKLFDFVKDCVRQALLQDEMIPDVSLRTAKEQRAITIEQQRKSTLHVPEPFEQKAREKHNQDIFNSYEGVVTDPSGKDKILSGTKLPLSEQTFGNLNDQTQPTITGNESTMSQQKEVFPERKPAPSGPDNTTFQMKIPQQEQRVQQTLLKKENLTPDDKPPLKEEQITLPVEQFISEAARPAHRLIGQLFRTYWLIEYDNKLYIMDQHAAHEKVMFERLMKQMSEKNVISQQLLPPKVLHLDNIEHTLIMNQIELFRQTGFDLEDFGDDSIVIRSMPDDIMGVDPQQLFDALLNSLLDETGSISIDFFVEKLSGMACKAAIKGNWDISVQEADALLDELLTLENPYNCPHGRPTMITLTKTELERKFKRIQN